MFECWGYWWLTDIRRTWLLYNEEDMGNVTEAGLSEEGSQANGNMAVAEVYERERLYEYINNTLLFVYAYILLSSRIHESWYSQGQNSPLASKCRFLHTKLRSMLLFVSLGFVFVCFENQFREAKEIMVLRCFSVTWSKEITQEKIVNHQKHKWKPLRHCSLTKYSSIWLWKYWFQKIIKLWVKMSQ